jgi:hypothetical protein
MTREPSVCLGQVSLSFEGHLDGWCCYPDHPQDRATVEVFLDGKLMRATMAARLRPELRDLGMGDGYYGFVIPVPLDAQQEGRAGKIEVRDRRLGRVIGRILLGGHDGDRRRHDRLTQIVATLDASARAITSLVLERKPNLSDHISDLGRILTSCGQQRRLGAVWQQGQSLAVHYAAVADIPQADLGWSLAPRVSVILPGTDALSDQAASLRAAAIALAPWGAEFILVDTGATPLTALMPTRLRHLRLLPAPGEPLGRALNDAALMARGDWLAFAQPGRLNAGLLADALGVVADNNIYAEGILTSASRLPDATVAEDGANVTFDRGLDCLISRGAFVESGGLDPSLATPEMWSELTEKARALDYHVVIWPVPRRMRSLAKADMPMVGVAGS